MTLTIPSAWALQGLSEAQPGRVIAKGNREDLQTLNQNVLRNFSADAASNLAVLSVPEGLTALTTTYAVVARGYVRVWGNGARVRLHVYGTEVQVVGTIGGAAIPNALQAGGADAWASGTAFVVSGATIDVDGFLDVEIEARFVVGFGVSANLKFVILEELPTLSANMPGPTHADTDFISMHDELYSTRDSSVDVELAQTLEDRVRQAMRARGPRCLHLYPRLGEIMRLSSVHWRLDGPYVVQVPPFCDRVDVAVTLEVIAFGGTPGDDFSVFALTEFEKFEDVADGRIQILSSATGAPETKTFLGLRARSGQPCKVWVAFKSRIGDSVDIGSLLVGHHSMQSPEKLYCNRDDGSFDGITMPWGLCIIADSEAVAASSDPAIKNARGYETPRGVVDLACINGLDPNTENVGSLTELTLTISPHPGTGISTSPSFSPVPTLQAGVAVDLRTSAVAQLLGVYVEATVAAVVRSKRARARRPVSAGIPALVMSRVNNLTVNCVPLAALRHGGQRLVKPPATPTGGTLYFESSYLHVQGAAGAGNIALWQVPLCDPNAGVSSGLITRKLYGQAVLMVVNSYNAANGQENLATVGFSFTGANEVLDNYKLRFRPNYGRNQSPTEADVVVSAWATHTVFNAYPTGGPVSPVVEYENAYTQTNTWPSEGYHEQGVWDVSPVFEMALPESFPAVATIEVYPKGTARYSQSVQVVVAGINLWWGPRT